MRWGLFGPQKLRFDKNFSVGWGAARGSPRCVFCSVAADEYGKGFDTGPPQVGAGFPVLLCVFVLCGPFLWALGRISFPPGPILGSVFQCRCFFRQKPPCRVNIAARSLGSHCLWTINVSCHVLACRPPRCTCVVRFGTRVCAHAFLLHVCLCSCSSIITKSINRLVPRGNKRPHFVGSIIGWGRLIGF